MSKRSLTYGTAAMLFAVVFYSALCRLLPEESMSQLLVADFGMVTIEVAALVLCVLTFTRSPKGFERWVWLGLSAFLVSNLFGDATWVYYDVVLHAEVPTPSVADAGYLLTYPFALLTVALGAIRGLGRVRLLEASLDALMLTLGLAGVLWPLLLHPALIGSSSGAEFWVNLAYPLGDLLVIFALVSLLLGADRHRLPRPMIAVLALFVIQVVADSIYFGLIAAGDDYLYGGWLDIMWTLAIALAGVAALAGMRDNARRKASVKCRTRPEQARAVRNGIAGHARIVVPYLAIPMIAGMIVFQVDREGMYWSLQMQILAYLGITVVAIILGRQSLALRQNRQLSDSLSVLSGDLAGRVEELAALTQRLQTLNVQANHLNALHSVPEIALKGVDLACLAANARAGWIVLTDSGGAEQIAAVYPADSWDNVPLDPDEDEEVHVLPLETRSGVIGKACVIRRTGADPGPSMAEAITAHIATAIENTRRYEEALRQAQNDALTGLLNHRSIHARLAEECKRADRTGAPVSLVMMDADDFKVLNDTYGHPAGDQVLLQIGQTIRGLLRQSDTAGRVGGDEFMLILPNTDGEGAAKVSERLRHMLVSAPFRSPTGQVIPLGLSLGVATYPTDAELPARLVEVADANLYISKQRGGDAVTGCESSRETPDDEGGMLGMAGRLLDVVGARDHYTRRHSEQVVTYSLALGDAIGLSEDSKHTLRLAAMLHDVGKIGVSVRVLRKPGALDPEESELVRRHVGIGESLIRDMPRLEAVLRAVRSHHEWHDGKGYPDGIGGDDIPLLAKILAIADAYAAMIVDKPYRRGMPGHEAERELLRVAGTQLDPDLVREFIRTCVHGSAETELAPT